MPRGPVVYSLPPGTIPQEPNTTIQSEVHNNAFGDIEQTFNTPTPVAYGGTGGANITDAAAALQIPSYGVVQTLSQDEKGRASKNIGQAWEQVGNELLITTSTAFAQWTGLSAYKRLRFKGFAVGSVSGAFLTLNQGNAGGIDGGSTYFRRAVYSSGASSILTLSDLITFHQIGQAAGIGANKETVFEGSIENFNKAISSLIQSISYGETATAERTYIQTGTLHNFQIARDTVRMQFSSGNILAAGIILEGQKG